MTPRIPVIDIAPIQGGDRASLTTLAQTVDRACRDLGFLVIAGHGVDLGLIDRLHREAASFFALPMPEKRKVAIGTVSEFNGYDGAECQNLSRTLTDADRAAKAEAAAARPPDLRETYQIGPVDILDEPYYTDPAGAKYFAPNAWPAAVPGLEPMITAYYRALAKVGRDVLRLLALALGLPQDWFDDKTDRPIGTVLINHYPGLSATPAPGQLRASPHTDFGAVTVLHQGSNPKGLQVLDADGAWFDVVAPAGCFVVNLGDLMAQWTNDVWRSTLHRVVIPDDAAARAPRQSITFFLRPNYDAVISCIETCTGPDNPPRHAAITSAAYYDWKIGLLRNADPGSDSPAPPAR